MNFRKTEAFLEKFSKDYQIPACDLKVMQDHHCIFRCMKGYRDKDKTEPVSEKDLYDFYSCTKPLTAAAVLRLREMQKLSLEDPVSRYLPEYKDLKVAKDYVFELEKQNWPDEQAEVREAETEMSVFHLLTMTSGMGYDLNAAPLKRLMQENPAPSTREAAAAMARMPLLFDPGKDWLYSLAHDVLGAVIEAASGQSFGEFLEEEFFAPLGMQHSYMKEEDIPFSELSQYYFYEPEKDLVRPIPYKNEHRFGPRYESGGAGLCATTDDYSLFADMLACGGLAANGKRILSEESVALMRRDHLSGKPRKRFSETNHKGYSYGLGVRTLVDPESSPSPLQEFGWSGAAGAYALFDRKNKLSITYTQQILNDQQINDHVHPVIRDHVYEALMSD